MWFDISWKHEKCVIKWRLLETIRLKAPPCPSSVVPSPGVPQIAEAGRFIWETARTTSSQAPGCIYIVQSPWPCYFTILSSLEVRVIIISKGNALKVMSQPIHCRAHLRLFHSKVISPHCPIVWMNISLLFPDFPSARGETGTCRNGSAFSPLGIPELQFSCRNEERRSPEFRVAMTVIKRLRKIRQNKNEMAHCFRASL